MHSPWQRAEKANPKRNVDRLYEIGAAAADVSGTEAVSGRKNRHWQKDERHSSPLAECWTES
jgi:hypothetical protein